MRRGSTLIEMMIVVAIIGITAAGTGIGLGYLDRIAMEEVQRERALQILEYEADVIARGAKASPEARRELLQLLPGATLESKAAGGLVEIVVRWPSEGGEMSRSLLVTRRPS